MARSPSRRTSVGIPWKQIILLLFGLGTCFALGIALGVFLLAQYGDFPSIDNAAIYKPSVSSKIYDRGNRVVGEIFLERRTVVPYETIPRHVVDAFVSAEDDKFFKHKGIDYVAIARAAFKDVFHLGYAQGASTITQQTVKQLFLTPEKSIRRKLKEIILSWRIEKKLTKEQILWLYLNQLYLGEGSYGVEAAARAYFGKGVAQISVAEGAMLAGLAPKPSGYSPRAHMELAKNRQKYVLRRMVETGVLSTERADEALRVKIVLAPPSTFRSKAAYFLEFVKTHLLERYGQDAVYKNQLSIYTTIDDRLQEAAYDAVSDGIKRNEERNKTKGLQGSFLCLDPHTGGVLAMVGGVDFAESQFNRALQAKRQPGSAFKPFVYAAALDKGRTVASMVDDSPIEFSRNETDLWKPRNYDGTFLGPIPIIEALAKSRNLAAVRLLSEIGVDSAIGTAQALGIDSPIERNLSIALGSSSCTMLEMCVAYASFATLGERPTPYFIREVRDAKGTVLESTQPKIARVLPAETGYLSVRLLQEVVRSGTAASARSIGANIAGKTGTTNENTDAWFLGFSPDLVAGAWVGFDQPTPIGDKQSAATVALPIWADFMRKALVMVPDREFPVPPGITFSRIDLATGKSLPTGSSEGVLLPFKLGTVPEVALPGGAPERKKQTQDDLL